MKKMMLLMGLSSLSAFGNVWRDCTGWFQGAVDKSGDGYFQKGEWTDLRHAAQMGSGDTYWAKPYFTNKGQISIVSVAVDVASLGKTLSGESCLYLSAPDDVTGNNFDSVVLPVSAQATGDRYSVLLRFKRSSASHADNVLDWLINLGESWGGKTGLLVGINKGTHPEIVTTFGNVGTFQTGLFLDWDGTPPRSAHPERDCWHELAIIVDGTKVTYGLMQPGVPGSTNYGATEKWVTLDLVEKGLWDPTGEATKCIKSVIPAGQYRLGNEASGYQTPFRGWFHMAACWNRALTRSEVKEAFGLQQPSLLRFGCAECGSDLFAGSTAAVSEVDARSITNQSKMPGSLSAGDKVSLTFETDEYTKGLAQLLRIKSASGSAAGSLEIKVDDALVGVAEMASGGEALLHVAAGLLAASGAHTLSLKRVDVGAGSLRLDLVEFGGSRRFGKNDGHVTYDTSSENYTENDYYAYDGNLRNLRYAVTRDRTVRLLLSLEEGVAANCPLEYQVKAIGAKNNTLLETRELLVNGNSVYTDLATNGVFTLKFRPGTLQAGDNTFEWRFKNPQNAGIWWQFDYQQFEIGKPRTGLVLIFR